MVIALVSALVCAALAAALAVQSHRTLSRLRSEADAAFTDLAAELRSRHELVPHVLASTQRYLGSARYEASNVATARHAARTATIGRRGLLRQARAENALSQALADIFRLVSEDPAGATDPTVTFVRAQVVDLADRVDSSVLRYNTAASRYMAKRGRPPFALMTGIFGFAPREEFVLEA
ncbi:LemA family protein [Hoyosella subflava]|uniref:LemA n=1 Tax=Hoyosella subflava (strain DSM 45089 / JCM 17490 / NBRC 109087 / DQS3-9A1) TaxID=443218 RepID=F6EFR3_HOYSD|nr:LemA family protein [Hoyosella subflava]AEF40992.1 LemA [Hoyosella subflava DQS3-9A1]